MKNSVTMTSGIFLLFLLLISGGLPVWGDEAVWSNEPTANISLAHRLYEAARYEAAVQQLRYLIRQQPDNAKAHHLLGKCYGRLAESAGGFKAMGFARKTRKAFEKAVALDETNRAAIADLITYFKEAPGFLGGSRKKAADWQRRLKALQNHRPPEGAEQTTAGKAAQL